MKIVFDTKSGKLDLWSRRITDVDIPSKILIHLVPGVVELNLDKNELTGDGAMTLFEHITKYAPWLTTINLYKNNLGIDGAKSLAAVLLKPECKLEKVDLNENSIQDEGLEFIAHVRLILPLPSRNNTDKTCSFVICLLVVFFLFFFVFFFRRPSCSTKV
jgi:hypothetical protein